VADVKSPSTKDLLLLITGLEVPKSPPAKADSGKVYWLNEATTTEDRTLRESKLNLSWFASPIAAWDRVRFRDWLIATLFSEIAKNKHEFVAISEPLLASLDVLGTEFTRDMPGVSETIKEALKTKEGRSRSLFNTLSFGVSRHVIKEKEVFMFGAGMRRRARFWRTESTAIQADVEIFVPFYEIPNSEPAGDPYHANSINAGIAISYSDGSPLGTDEESKQELMAVRYNLRVPFGSRWAAIPKSDEYKLETVFDAPEIKIQKRLRENTQSPTSGWQEFKRWKEFTEPFCESIEGRELLNVPIGPLLLEKIDNPASIKDIILKQSKRDKIKAELAESQKEFKETIEYLKNITDPKTPDKDGAGPNAGQRKLGHMLESLGFMTAKGGGPESDYTFKIAKGLTVWDVINRLFAELDGYPLWVKGATPKTDKEKRIAVAFASQTSETDLNKSYFGLAGLIYNIPLKTVPPDAPAEKDKDKDDDAWIVISEDNFSKDESIFLDDDEDEEDDGAEPKPEPEKKDEKKSTLEVYGHLGKWMSGETVDDNWYRRLLPLDEKQQKPRVPIPGIRVLPFKRTRGLDLIGNEQAVFSWTFRADLLSFGVDLKGATKDGLTFLQGLAGHFGLGTVEIRLAVSVSAEDYGVHKEWYERFSIGVGVKLKDLRLSLGPKDEEEKKKDSGNEIMDGIENILSDEWLEELAPEKSKSPKVKTRLSAKKKDKFSISFGYLTQLTKDSKGTLDIQLYDEKGNRGKMALIPIDRAKGPIYLRRIGIALKGVENIELANGLPDSAQLTVALTGGIRLQVFELGFIGAKLIFQLNNPSAIKFGLDGLDVSVKIGSVVISGSFFKVGIEYAGMLTVDIPKASFSAMGFYGSLRIVHVSREAEIVTDLNNGKVHKKLKDKLAEKKITPAESSPIKKGRASDEWELYTADNKQYTITDEDEKLNVLGHEKTFFVYAMLNAASGCGPTFGPIQFTGIAFGYGHNRRLKVPRIEQVAEFPLVQMVMGEGGYQKDGTDTRSQLSKPLEDPVAMLEKFKDHVVPEAGQQFACGGVRFTVGGIIDCFALMVVQWSEKDIELTMLGLARFRHTRDLKSPPICYVEMQILMSLKPSEGTFQLQALLTNNSWIVSQNCKLTGGFALFIWFGGKHKGDWVITFGGYHPRFVRPAHYPIVPRLGLNWPVNDNLTIKGGIYLAITPSCGMLGARMEATFHSGRISAWFTAYLDVIVNWEPLYFEAEIGISLRVEASLFLTSIKVTIGASIQLWGPPVGGIAHIDLTVISFDIDFGEARPKKPELVKSWEQFCHNFLNLSGSDTEAIKDPVKAFPIVQPNLVAGRQNLNTVPNSHRAEQQTKRDDDLWKVRADELELAAATVVPVSTLNFGKSSAAVQDRSLTGQPVMIKKPLALETKGLLRANKPQKLGVHPMGKSLDSVLNCTIVRDEASTTDPIELSKWTMEEEQSALPAALWDPDKPNLRPSEPSAKMIDGGITGIKKIKPPRGKLGNEVVAPPLDWRQLDAGTVLRSATAQGIPAASQTRNLQPVMAQMQDNQKKVVAALAAAGFTLTWQPPAPADVRFRELQADPLAGAVAA
jgi:hypothetical protein